MSNTPLSVNMVDWDSTDINNKFIINGYGIDNDGNNIGLKITDFKPEYFIRIKDKEDRELIDVIEDRINLFIKNLELISKKSLYCKKTGESESESESDSESDSDEKNKKKKCNCLNCLNIDLLKSYPDEYDFYKNSNYYKKLGNNINNEDTIIIEKKDLYDGFNYDKKKHTSSKYYEFLQISFNNIKSFNKVKRLLFYEIFEPRLNKKVKNRFIKIDGIPIYQLNIDFYETSILPLLRFFHKRQIKPVGWINIDKTNLTCIKDQTYFNCDECYEVEWNKINPSDRIDFGNFKIMSWDIEADSEYGDFPSAIKEYNKQASEIADYYLEKINNNKDVTKIHINSILKKMFNYEDDIDEIYKKDNLIFQKWINEKKNEKKKQDNNGNDSDFYSDDFDSEEEFINKKEEEEAELKSNRDIIVYRINKLLINKFGKHVRGDRITQIGAVFYKYGKQDEYDKFILTLGSCDTFTDDSIIIKTTNDNNKLRTSKDIIKKALEYDENHTKIIPFYIKEKYDNFNNKELDKLEKKLILSFKELIVQYNPDMILAFNNFGFDNPFLMNRCKELKLLDIKCNNKFCKGLAKYCYSRNPDIVYCEYCKTDNMIKADLKETFNINRLNTETTNMETKVLTSAALGDNTLYLINSKGRVHIDLLKEVQRTHNLESYKLDFIAEKFLGDHKDDVSATQIFAYQKMDGHHRGIIAKYCVQDCVLLLNLIKKLDTCSSNMGMANVSLIPFTYIFLRGQGIKIQSLVGEFCMNEDTLLKTLDKSFSDDSYEGAVVLPPTVGMYLKDGGVGVLDYASLYPNSMIGSNISHDTIVESIMTDYKSLDEIENLKFDNMREGIKFENLYELIKEKNKEFTEDDIQNLIKDIQSKYHIYPLYDSIYIPEIKTRFVRFINFYKIYNKKRDNPSGNLNLNIRGYNYVSVYFDTYKGKGDTKRKNGIKKLTFANPINTEEKGIMCKILKKLLSQRKHIRKVLMPNEPDEFKRGVYEGLQLAYKCSANSLYGQTGSSVSCISQVDLASSTTSTGRQMLSLCKSFAEEYFECDVVYGDSVAGDEPLILRNQYGLIEIKTIETLSNEWQPYENFKPFDTITSNRRDKEKSFVNYEVFANNKWNPIKKVIRHKTNKKIYRVNTHCGVVDVTEDHSLLNENNEKIKPNDCIINETKLLQSFPEFDEKPLHLNEIVEILYQYENYDRTLDEKLAFIYGMFYGDGSCGFYNCKSGDKYSWAINNQDRRLLQLCKQYLKEIFTDNDFKILETMKSSSVLKLVPKGSIKSMVNKFRPLFYDKDKFKIIPNQILNGNQKIRLNFFLGYYAADGYKCDNTKTKNICFSNKGKIGSCQLYYICKSLGYNSSICIRPDKLNIYKITCTLAKQRKQPNILKKMIYLRDTEDEYVYDLETQNGNFNCGVGEITVKNTDSIFLKFHDHIFEDIEDKPILDALNQKLTKKINYDDNTKISKRIKGLIEVMDKTEGKTGLKITILRCEVLSAEIAQLLRPPHDLEYEKTFRPFCLISKKRYFGDLFETDPAIGNLKYMGICLKRRDSCKIVKDAYMIVVDTIMKERSIDASIEKLQNKLLELIEGKIPIEDLTITKTLRGHYKNRGMIAHAVLADRIQDRTGEKVPSNTRIPYVFVNVKQKRGENLKQGQRIELPKYVLENKLQLDYEAYIRNQIMKPILQIYDLEMKYPDSIFRDVLRKASNTKTKTNEITKWFQPADKKEIKETIKLEKGCIFMIKKGITAKKKCNKDIVPGTNYCEKHCKKEKIENKKTNTLKFEKLLKV